MRYAPIGAPPSTRVRSSLSSCDSMRILHLSTPRRGGLNWPLDQWISEIAYLRLGGLRCYPVDWQGNAVSRSEQDPDHIPIESSLGSHRRMTCRSPEQLPWLPVPRRDWERPPRGCSHNAAPGLPRWTCPPHPVHRAKPGYPSRRMWPQPTRSTPRSTPRFAPSAGST